MKHSDISPLPFSSTLSRVKGGRSDPDQIGARIQVRAYSSLHPPTLTAEKRPPRESLWLLMVVHPDAPRILMRKGALPPSGTRLGSKRRARPSGITCEWVKTLSPFRVLLLRRPLRSRFSTWWGDRHARCCVPGGRYRVLCRFRPLCIRL